MRTRTGPRLPNSSCSLSVGIITVTSIGPSNDSIGDNKFAISVGDKFDSFLGNDNFWGVGMCAKRLTKFC